MGRNRPFLAKSISKIKELPQWLRQFFLYGKRVLRLSFIVLNWKSRYNEKTMQKEVSYDINL